MTNISFSVKRKPFAKGTCYFTELSSLLHVKECLVLSEKKVIRVHACHVFNLKFYIFYF